jgi:diaminopimelate epimerase
MTVRATKMHGLGNDYIYVDAFQQRVADPTRLARAVSDRHTGVGSDGLILIGPATEPGAHLRMRIHSSEVSEETVTDSRRVSRKRYHAAADVV